jgi:hypothetical protein
MKQESRHPFDLLSRDCYGSVCVEFAKFAAPVAQSRLTPEIRMRFGYAQCDKNREPVGFRSNAPSK